MCLIELLTFSPVHDRRAFASRYKRSWTVMYYFCGLPSAVSLTGAARGTEMVISFNYDGVHVYSAVQSRFRPFTHTRLIGVPRPRAFRGYRIENVDHVNRVDCVSFVVGEGRLLIGVGAGLSSV